MRDPTNYIYSFCKAATPHKNINVSVVVQQVIISVIISVDACPPPSRTPTPKNHENGLPPTPRTLIFCFLAQNVGWHAKK